MHASRVGTSRADGILIGVNRLHPHFIDARMIDEILEWIPHEQVLNRRPIGDTCEAVEQDAEQDEAVRVATA